MVFLWSSHDMRRKGKGEKNHGGGPFWIMRKSFWRKISRGQNQTPRLLLANHGKRLREIRPEVREMPKACSNNPSTRGNPLFNLVPLSFHAMVHGHCRTYAPIKTKTLPPSPHGFLFQMGRSRILRKYQRHTSRELRLEAYHN